MTFEKGNRLWEKRAVTGRSRAFATPEDLEAACLKYFQEAQDSMLQVHVRPEDKRNGVTKGYLDKRRIFSLPGLCLHIGVVSRTWERWKQKDGRDFREDLQDVMGWAEEVISADAIEGSAAGIYDSRFTLRLLKMAEPIPEPHQYSDEDVAALDKRIAELMSETLKANDEPSDDSKQT